ncbi:hypothetical protein Ari01nite_68930 [Paractinoplanes rishiriensis]|uniref:Peptidase S1 domain-containing protein n=1 Tax=Paractinoplanes rishiriensis TaxID=1050105 RepID=A0A919MXW8_9ACTN|nr:hypothetical protein Ari01nite_68930 [Actinoplanes rishiriensis]
MEPVMRIRSGLTILAAVVVTSAGGAAIAHTASAGTAPGPMIIGGDTVASAPWAAAVFNGGGFSCSGSIVAERYVLTAHHCINGNQMTVRAGSVQRSSGGVVATVVRTASQHDLALLELDRSVGTSFVTLAGTNPPIGSTNTIYGWGQTCQSGCGASGQLKVATVRFDRLSRDAEGGQALQSSRINGNAWYGDSGGPQFYNDQQVGVASTADGQSIQNYSSVPNSIAWIRSVIGTPGPAPTTPPAGTNLARSATASASYTSSWESVAAVNDGAEPASSNDTVNPRWGTWPNEGEQSVTLTWPQAQRLTSASVYFFDDNGGVRLPASWRLQYLSGGAFTDVPGASGYPVAANGYNAVTFPAVSTTQLRVVLQSGTASVGLLEVQAYGA